MGAMVIIFTSAIHRGCNGYDLNFYLCFTLMGAGVMICTSAIHSGCNSYDPNFCLCFTLVGAGVIICTSTIHSGSNGYDLNFYLFPHLWVEWFWSYMCYKMLLICLTLVGHQ
jgi:hypothetical protein